jgi:hypothetical protein
MNAVAFRARIRIGPPKPHLSSVPERREYQMRHHVPGAKCILTMADGVRLPGTVTGRTTSPAGCVNVRTDRGNHYCLPFTKVEVLP